MFTDEYEHTIDSKQRLAIPAGIRSLMDPQVHGSAFYASPGPNRALWLWPEKTFQRMAQTMRRSFVLPPELADFKELFFSQSPRLEIDAAGRIRLPDRLMERYGLKATVTILGVNDHLELRDSEQWRTRRDQMWDQLPQIMEQAYQALEEQDSGGGKAGS